uniref:GIY-YIG nuclease family protein n=1 Tax=Rhodanobacter glycinis TaxID=582702 RepID=UPI00155AAE0F|nr:GIY-YIG nuclease family protein [Rhodanobacter glycinis]
MKQLESDAFIHPRFADAGRTYVYVLPCHGEDLLKVGFTRDPMQRFRTLHRRFYAFFDLEAALLIETEHLREARRLERLFIERWPEHQAPAPLAIPHSAAGHTEWFRGIRAAVSGFANTLAQRYGYEMHAPLRAWLSARFRERSDVLFDWALRMLDFIEYQTLNVSPEDRTGVYAQALGDALDACRSVGLDVDTLVPDSVLRWYEKRSDS